MLHAPDKDLRKRPRLRTPHKLRDAAQKNKQRNARHENRERRLADQRAKQRPLENERHPDAADERDRHADAPGQLHAERESPDEQRAEQQDLALRQIDDARGAVNYYKRHGDQPVDEADQQSVDDDLEHIDHGAGIVLFMSWPRRLD
jgi:hypothetical protein